MPDPALVEYIRRNRSIYTDDALRQQLIAQGHPPGEVDAALAEANASTLRRRAIGGVGNFESGAFWLALVATVLAIFGIAYFAALRLPDIFVPLVAVMLVAGVIAALFAPFDAEVRRGIGCGVAGAVVIPIVAVLGLYVYCLVAQPHVF